MNKYVLGTRKAVLTTIVCTLVCLLSKPSEARAFYGVQLARASFYIDVRDESFDLFVRRIFGAANVQATDPTLIELENLFILTVGPNAIVENRVNKDYMIGANDELLELSALSHLDASSCNATVFNYGSGVKLYWTIIDTSMQPVDQVARCFIINGLIFLGSNSGNSQDASTGELLEKLVSKISEGAR